MAETLLDFQAPVVAPDGTPYRARAVGSTMPDGMWQGWIEFEPVAGGEPLRSPRETTQPNHADTVYWATGLTYVYLEGALARALSPAKIVLPRPPSRPAFDDPAPTPVTVAPALDTAESVLDPFSVYEKGEIMLRRQLGALSAWHLVNIIVDYQLSNEGREALSRMPAQALIDLIVDAVRSTVEGAKTR